MSAASAEEIIAPGTPTPEFSLAREDKETFTRAEKTLVARGEGEAIQHIRRRFQQQMAEDFTSIVEQVTGRKVRAFLSETDIEQDVSVETFLLAGERTDMTGFEEG